MIASFKASNKVFRIIKYLCKILYFRGIKIHFNYSNNHGTKVKQAMELTVD